MSQETSQSFGEEDEQKVTRVYIWAQSLKVLETSPIFGVGLGITNYRKYLSNLEGTVLASEAVYVLSQLEHPHNS